MIAIIGGPLHPVEMGEPTLTLMDMPVAIERAFDPAVIACSVAVQVQIMQQRRFLTKMKSILIVIIVPVDK